MSKEHHLDPDSDGDGLSPEQVMYQAVVILREQGIKTQFHIADANIPEDKDGDGKWDENPDNFGGAEPGNATIRTFAEGVDGHVIEQSETSLLESDLDSEQHADPDGLASWIEGLHNKALSGVPGLDSHQGEADADEGGDSE